MLADVPPTPPALVILAPEALAAPLAPLVEQRASRFSVELVTLESMLAAGASTPEAPGEPARAAADDAEKLKLALFARWSKPGAPKLTHVLLVGDADVLPVRYMVLDRCTPQAFNFAFYPSDLYYADLAKPDGSFESWNASREGFHAGYFGEVRGECNKDTPINFDRIDYRPEIAIGRWPVSTPEAVRIVVEKTLAYERSVAGTSKRGVVVAVGGWIENRPSMDALAARLSGDSWTMDKLYWGDGSPTPPDEANVVQALNTGARLVLHSGHGSDDAWDQSISVASLKKLTNAAAPAVVFSAGCSTARFATLPPYEAYIDVEGAEHAGTNAGQVFASPPPPPACYQKGRYNLTGLGEQMVVGGPAGAVAYMGCNTGSQPCGMTLMAAFADAAASGTPTIGECWASAVREYYTREHLEELKPDEGWYPPSIFFQGMKFMLFGDPSAPMPD